MAIQPTISTERLLLRPFSLDDAPAMLEGCNNKELAKTTLNLPYPYKKGMAEEWINTHQPAFDKGKQVYFAITLIDKGTLIGGLDLRIQPEHECAEIGYLLYQPYWNNGYITEAAGAAVKFTFQELKLNRVFAHHMDGNDASGRVMRKIGMKYEGVLRQQVKKWGEYKDMVCYGILRDEFTD